MEAEVVPPWIWAWAGISFTLLSFNAAEPEGRSQFRGVVVYGRTRASEQEFIT